MKNTLFLLLSVLFWLWCGSPPAQAVTPPRVNFVYIMAFGETTPPNSGGSFGNSAGSDTSGNNTPDSNTPDSNTPGSNTPGSSAPDSNAPDSNAPDSNAPGSNAPGSNAPDSNTPDSNSSGAQAGGTIVNVYEPDAYASEKTAEQQIIDQAQQQYGGPRLSAIYVGGLALIPVFSNETFSYSVYVPQGQNSVSVTAQAASGSVYIDGVAGNSRQLYLGNGETTVSIIVTEQSSTTTYSIQLLRNPQLQQVLEQQVNDIPMLTRIEVFNEDLFCEQDINVAGGDIRIVLPQASDKKVNITLFTNIEALLYCDNIRVYNGLYYPTNGIWQWKRQNLALNPTETRLQIVLAEKSGKTVIGTYNLILQQPQGLSIQLQVGNEQALVNSVLHILDAPPLIVQGHTMVPLRFIAEALGAQVNWHSGEKRVELSLREQTLNLFIGKLTEGMAQAPFIDSGRTMVPLRYVSERLSCQVEWLAATREIVITKQ